MLRPEDVRGFSKLNDSSKQYFATFLKNYCAAVEKPELIKEVTQEKYYLKVTFETFWLHVTGPSTWY